MGAIGTSTDTRTLLNDLERVKVALIEAQMVVEAAQRVISDQQNKLYDRDRYVESLEARLLELSSKS